MSTPVYSEETFNYEILLRFGDSDPYKGQLRGAHRQTITQTKKDGVIIAASIDPPEQLSLLEGERGLFLFDLLGDISAETIVQNGILQNTISDLQERLDKQKEIINHYVQENAGLEAGVAALKQSLKGALDTGSGGFDSIQLEQ